MKRAISLVLLIMMCLPLCACDRGGSSSVSSVDPTEINSVVRSETETNKPETEESTMHAVSTREVASLTAFSDNRAWVKYKEDDVYYYALVGTDGNAIVRFNDHGNFWLSQFSGGYAYITDHRTNNVHIIDTTGKITYSYSTDFAVAGVRIMAQDSGFVITEKNVSGFDATGYEYTVYNHSGSVMEQITSEDEIYITACGRGVFRFAEMGYYCAQSGAWVDDEITESSYLNTPVFLNDTQDAIVIGTVEDGDRKGFTILYPDGTTKTAYFDWSNYSRHVYTEEISCVVQDTCVVATTNMNSNENTYVALNFSTEEQYELDEKYLGSINEGIACTPANNRIVIPMSGADGYRYIAVFDLEMNLIYGPVQSTTICPAYSGSRIVFSAFGTTNKIVYDQDGNAVYSLTELGYNNEKVGSEEEQYSCGILLAYDSAFKPVYLNAEGEQVMISFNSITTLDIPSEN